MVGTYEIRQGTRCVGTAKVSREGLYCLFSCRCRPVGEGMWHLVAVGDSGKTDLGICVPMEEGFGVEKRIPRKYLGGEIREFLLLPKHATVGGRFVPVYPEEPFAYMTKLKNAFLATQNGQTGILIID